MRPRSCGAFLSLCVATAACSSGPPLFTPNANMVTYVGLANDSVEGAGTVRATVASAAGVTGGTWERTFGGKSRPTLTMNGSLSGTHYTGTMTSSSNDQSTFTGCAYTIDATLTADNFNGTYRAFAVTPACPSIAVGTFTLAKQ